MTLSKATRESSGQAPAFSSSIRAGEAATYAHDSPEARSAPSTGAMSYQLFGVASGSSPARRKASRL